MAGIATGIYNTLIRKNHIYLLTIFASAFAFEMTFDRGFDKLWDNVNRGRQWKDIRLKYIEKDEEEE